MYGSIIGDICGSIYEWNNYKTESPEKIKLINQKCFFTDNTVLTCAIAEAILRDGDYKNALLKWARKYPNKGYGIRFIEWFKKEKQQPYKSWGNGSAMRAGPIGWYFDTLEETVYEAKKSAELTHNHKEGIKGAQAVAAAVFLARNDKSKMEIKEHIEKEYGYKLSENIIKLRQRYTFDSSCKGTVPPAIMAFLASNDFEHAIQTAISLGGDSDTLACITGSISEAFYKNIPTPIIDFVNLKIPDDMGSIISEYYEKVLKKYGLKYYIKKGKIMDVYI
jgi:ADP-ribosylglycohydrolase